MKRTLVLLATLFLLHTQSKSQVIYDYDGNAYDTVIIGTQVWLKQNLKTTHYLNGEMIPNITDSHTWSGFNNGARCYYNNDSTVYHNLYGALYNWYAAISSKQVCPLGWHVPTHSDWIVLEDYLGGAANAGGMMKESGTLHWSSPNTDATNSSRFTGLPAGMRGMSDEYELLGENGLWWTSSSFNASMAWSRYLWYLYAGVDANPTPKKLGLSIRCLRDAATGIKTTTPLKEVSIFPNPANDKIVISTAFENGYSITIYDNLGKSVIREKAQTSAYEISIQHLPAGIYVVMIEGADFFNQQKFVKY